MSDLTERLTEAATLAIRDIGPAIDAVSGRLKLVTVEVEVGTHGQLLGATAWLENRVNVNTLLGTPAERG